MGQVRVVGVRKPGVADIVDDPSRVVPVFQPVVELSTGRVIGYEALARWPNWPDVSPPEAFEAARERGTVSDVDWWCRKRAVDLASDSGFGGSHYLFVNVEPGSLTDTPPAERLRHRPVVDVVREGGLQVILELTEETLLQDPPAVLAAVQWARGHGLGIALDDVGAVPECLALLDVIAPDVIKLDRSLTQMSEPGMDSATAISATADYARRCDATILAEGIESDLHKACARHMGATLGQGYRFGVPAPLPSMASAGDLLPGMVDPSRGDLVDLTQLLDHVPSTTGSAPEIAGMCDTVERAALGDHPPGCVVSLVGGPRPVDAGMAGRYRELAARHLLVGICGPGVPEVPPPGVRASGGRDAGYGGAFGVASIGADHAVAVLASPIDRHARSPTEFRWCVTTDRGVVSRISRRLMGDLARR